MIGYFSWGRVQYIQGENMIINHIIRPNYSPLLLEARSVSLSCEEYIYTLLNTWADGSAVSDVRDQRRLERIILCEAYKFGRCFGWLYK